MCTMSTISRGAIKLTVYFIFVIWCVWRDPPLSFMQVSYIEKKSIDNLSVSTLVGDRIFLMKGKQLVSRSIYSYDIESSPYETFEDRVDYIAYFNGFLMVFCGNILHKYKVFENELVLSDSHLLREPPVKVFICGTPKTKETHAMCFLYRNKKLEIFMDKVEGITVCCKGDIVREDDIIDLFVTDISSWFLSRSGNIYQSHSFVLTRNALLHKPIKMLPEPTTFSGEAFGLIVRENRLYLSYEDGFEMYNIFSNVLILAYTYKTSNFELVESGRVFCIEENLLMVEDAPRMVSNVRVQKLFGGVGVSSDRVLFIREDRSDVKGGMKLLKEGDSLTRVNEMFKPLTTNFKVPDIPSDEEKISEKTFLMVQKVINDFESRILDGHRKIYFELVTLNESFSEKIDGLSAENKAILKKADVLDERKNDLVSRLRNLNDRMDAILSDIMIDGNCVRMLIDKVNASVDGIESKRYEKYAKILRMQREILSRRVI